MNLFGSVLRITSTVGGEIPRKDSLSPQLLCVRSWKNLLPIRMSINRLSPDLLVHLCVFNATIG